MTSHLSRIVFTITLVSLISWAFVAGGQFQDNYVPGEVIIKLSDATNAGDASAVRSLLGASVKQQFTSIGAELWALENATVPDAIGLVRGDPRVEYIEPNYIVTADDLFPNDPRFPDMWALHNIGQTGGTPDADIDAPEAWSIETGDSVLVGVIDTGVDWHHIDLEDNIYTNPGEIPGNGIDDDGNGYVDDVHGWDFVNNDNDPYDDNGHGTHVSGTIAAAGNNGIGVVGVSWSARILPIKFLSAGGGGSTSNAILSVEYATLMGVRLTNNSWGGGGYSTALRNAIEAAGNAGILFVAAAGNYGENTDIYPHYPSSYDLDNIISVANTTHTDQLSGSSNYGATSVDLGAPGSNILSTFPGNSYGSISGTSMATPHVSGAVSLLWSAAPSMAHLDVKSVIMASVDSIPALEGRTVSGGRLNVFTMLSGLDSIPPARVNDLAVQSTGSNTATLTWTATGDDSTHGTAMSYDLRYSTSQIYWNNFDAATPVPGMPPPQPSGSPETFMVTGLDFTTTYYFALVAVDEQDNRSWISNILVSGTTLGVPVLEYSPTHVSDSLLTGGSAAHTLTIRNTGEGTLDFVFPGAVTTGPGALPSWLRVEPPSGRVWAGESVEVQLVFDATGLFEGIYAEPVILETNDPGNASVVVSATLQVTNAPDIAASPESMDFGELYLGLVKTDTLVVTNIGTDVLTVIGLATDEPQFSVNPAGFTLGLGESRAVPVTFAPVAAGTITGTLSIQSNDPDHPTLAVALEGLGVEPPVISVTPPSLSDDLFTGGVSTHMLNIANSGGSALDFELSVEDVDSTAGTVSVFADVSLPGDVIKVGRPLDADELAALEATFPRSIAVGASDPVDNGAPSVPRSGDPMAIERVERLDLEEVFGSDQNMFTGSVRSRGNLFTCTTSTTLVEHRLYLNPSGSTEMWFLVYEGTAQVGIYDLVSASDVTPAGPGLGWYSSGDIRVPMEAGRYYLIVASFEQTTNYYNEQGISPYPIPASFGELTAGAGWDWAPPTSFPPYSQIDVPSYAFGGPVAYYQTLVTGSAVRWLSLAPEEGTVPPMTSMDVAVTFDAEGLNGGDYAAEIVVANNDPLNPEVIVPVDLHVTGAPNIVLSDTLLDYGPVFVGGAARDTLVVSNDGTDVLVVSEISASHGDYAVAPTAFALDPGEMQPVEITLAPSSAGPLDGVLTVTSNDPDDDVLTVTLNGEGIEPPVIVITPDSLADSLFTGEVTTHEVIIANSGAHDLDWAGRVRFAGTPQLVTYTLTPPVAGVADPETGDALDPEEVRTTPITGLFRDLTGTDILWDRAHGEQPMSVWSVIISDLVSRGATATENFQPITPEVLAGYDILWLTDYMTYWTGSEVMAVLDWVRGGGALIFECDESLTQINLLLAVLGTGIVYLDPPAAAGPTANIYPHETTEGVSLLMLAAPQSQLELSAPAGLLVDDIGYRHVCAYSEVGSGRVFALSDEIFNNGMIGALDNQLFANQVVDWLAGAFDWLEISPTDGTVAPGGSQPMEVTFDAADLDGGAYTADIVFTSNDPLNPEVIVPVTLDVTAIPDIAVSDSTLDFGTLFVGATDARDFTVSNLGNDDLVIPTIASTNPDVSAAPSSLTVPQGESRVVTVTFAPTVPGALSDTLTIMSNDPDEPEALIAVMGEALIPPEITVDPDSLSEALLSGETSTQTLTIANPGGSILEYWISVGPAADSAAVAASSALEPSARRNRSLSDFTAEGAPAAVSGGAEDPDPPDPAGSPLPGSNASKVLAAGTNPAEPSVTWLSVVPTSGTVDPGASVDITVEFDAAGLIGGAYEATLAVTTNVPAQPEVLVPVVLDVTGIPAIAVSDTLLDFGSVYLGFSKTLALTVRNTGTDDLEVSDISSNNAIFSAVPASFVLSPTQWLAVAVTITPAEIGPVSTVLSIASNDPANGTVEIDLAADVMLPPVVSTAPDSIVVSLAPSEIHVDTVYVTNTGGSDLEWNAATSNPAAAVQASPPNVLGSDGSNEPPFVVSNHGGGDPALVPLGALNILWHGNHGLGDIALWSVIISDLTTRGATVTQSSDPITETLLSGVDIVWFGDRDVSFTPPEVTALGEWMAAGGSILIEANSSGSYTVYNSLLEAVGSGVFYFLGTGTTGNTPNIHAHETTIGVDVIFLLNPAKTLGVLTPSAGPLVDDLLGRTVVAYDQIGDGRIVIMSDHIFHDIAIHNADNRLFANQVFNWFGVISWLSVTPENGTIGVGESVKIEVTIDATGLLGGSYQRNIDIRSNDPVTPIVTIPVYLSVDSTVSVTGINPDRLPERYTLHPNYPNPFNPTTTIAYDLPERTGVDLVIYDVGGRLVQRLVRATQPRGHYEVTWDGRNAAGEPASSGVYFYKLVAGDFVQTRKMVLLK